MNWLSINFSEWNQKIDNVFNDFSVFTFEYNGYNNGFVIKQYYNILVYIFVMNKFK